MNFSDFPKLMFITNYQSAHSHIEQVKRAIDAGVKWIQYRPKEVSQEQIVKEGAIISELCHQHKVHIILNDSVNLVAKTQSDGVHIGQKDMPADEARKILGKNYIIGGTANTLEDVLALVDKQVDYVGLGPFQFTGTKKNLSPVLGLEGYRKIMSMLKKQGISTPVYSIGGIQPNHIKAILETGVDGIAVSSVLSEASDMKKIMSEIDKELRKKG